MQDCELLQLLGKEHIINIGVMLIPMQDCELLQLLPAMLPAMQLYPHINQQRQELPTQPLNIAQDLQGQFIEEEAVAGLHPMSAWLHVRVDKNQQL